MSASVKTLVNQPYKYGFVTDIESDTIPKGLNEDVVRLISSKKNEPAFIWWVPFTLRMRDIILSDLKYKAKKITTKY